MWELEEARRWSSYLEDTLIKLKQEHHAAESGLKVWMESIQKGLVDISGSSSSVARNCDESKKTLNFVQSHFDDLESLVISRGVTDEDLGMDADSNSLGSSRG